MSKDRALVLNSLCITILAGVFAAAELRAAEPIRLPEKTVKILPTKDIVIIGWVRGDVIALPGLLDGVNPFLIAGLNTPGACSLQLGDWVIGLRTSILSDIDRVYANAFLLKNSANPVPPNSINPDQAEGTGLFRLFQRLQVAYRVKDGVVVGIPKFVKARAVVGSTPDPCGLVAPSAGEAHVANGARGITTTKTGVFQLNQGRIGVFGQAVDTTLNNPGGTVGATTPWIWSAIRFDLKGDAVMASRQIFPTYYVYHDGVLKEVAAQSEPETFISRDETSQQSSDVP